MHLTFLASKLKKKLMVALIMWRQSQFPWILLHQVICWVQHAWRKRMCKQKPQNAKELGLIRSANLQRKAARRMIRVQWYVSAPKTLFVFSCKNIQLCNFYSLLRHKNLHLNWHKKLQQYRICLLALHVPMKGWPNHTLTINAFSELLMIIFLSDDFLYPKECKEFNTLFFYSAERKHRWS